MLILQGYNSGKGLGGTPYHSTQGVPYGADFIMIILAITILVYLYIRVWKSLREDEKYGR